MRKLLALTVVVALGGCGDNSGTMNGADGGHDLAMSLDLSVTHDLATPPDLTPPVDFSGIGCGTQSCAAGSMCCANQSGSTVSYFCSSSCADAGIAFACDGPDNCQGSSAKLCCAHVTTTPDAQDDPPPMCLLSGYSACESSCTTQFPLSCSSSGQVVLCHRKADCAGDPNNSNCCLFAYNGNMLSLCADDTIKQFSAMCFN